jgi:hypothetical protein
VPARQIGKPKLADSNAEKMFDAVANGFKHAANLPIYSLPKDNAQFRGRDRADLCNLRSLSIEKNSAHQFRRECWVPRPIQPQLIFLVDFITRVAQPLGEVAIICEKKETLSLRVQTPDVEQPGKFQWKQIKDRVARVLIFSGRNKSGRFVQHDGKRRSKTNKFAIDFDVVVRTRLCAEVCADFPVDGNPTRRDQLIAMSARSDAGGGEKAIEAHVGE